MRDKPYRIIIDTNLWISFLITKDYTKLDTLLIKQKVELLFSKELLAEFIDVVNRPKLRKYFNSAEVERLLLSLEQSLSFIEVVSKVKACRDTKDNFLLALAKDGKANYLITGDNDLLILKTYGKTKIITISEFLSKPAG